MLLKILIEWPAVQLVIAAKVKCQLLRDFQEKTATSRGYISHCPTFSFSPLLSSPVSYVGLSTQIWRPRLPSAMLIYSKKQVVILKGVFSFVHTPWPIRQEPCPVYILIFNEIHLKFRNTTLCMCVFVFTSTTLLTYLVHSEYLLFYYDAQFKTSA